MTLFCLHESALHLHWLVCPGTETDVATTRSRPSHQPEWRAHLHAPKVVDMLSPDALAVSGGATCQTKHVTDSTGGLLHFSCTSVRPPPKRYCVMHRFGHAGCISRASRYLRRTGAFEARWLPRICFAVYRRRCTESRFEPSADEFRPTQPIHLQRTGFG